jgi:hypothetical protein
MQKLNLKKRNISKLMTKIEKSIWVVYHETNFRMVPENFSYNITFHSENQLGCISETYFRFPFVIWLSLREALEV